MPEDHSGERVAERYDESAADQFEPALVDPVVDFLVALAGDGAALELGSALAASRCRSPVAASACAASTSRRRWSRLRASRAPGTSTSRSATSPRRPSRGSFSLAYLVNLTTQGEQVACFRNVAAHLEPGGCFVIEVGVPDPRRLLPGEVFRPFAVSATRLGFDE